MGTINRQRKRLVPVDYYAMLSWLKSKGKPIHVENLGGGGPHSYTATGGMIVIDGKNSISAEQWQGTAVCMVEDIPAERLDVSTEYSKIRNYANPSIPVLCWAMCEELMNNNQVWNY